MSEKMKMSVRSHVLAVACMTALTSSAFLSPEWLATRHADDDELFGRDREVSIAVKGASLWGAKAYLLDGTHDLTEIPYRTGKDGTIKLTMKLNTAVYIELKGTNE